MSYTVLARRYRSQDFSELIGQEPIAKTLKRAIELNRTAHAYLFCGTRGVGKTSMARIFAKALNVNDSLQDKVGIAAAIMAGTDIDVIEIDGASNRGVDDARELISNSIYLPARCPYKIYIIDEVHMLTNEAFNALLKTMEEPPPHVKFILCTTEPHKVPPTIQSRCQRFDFRAIATASIAQHLTTLLKLEKVKADKQVIQQVASLGNGSMRDALSLLDRLLATGETNITMDLLQEMLGIPDQKLIENLINAIAAGDTTSSLLATTELLNGGLSLDQLNEVLVNYMRQLMLISVCNGNKEAEGQLIDQSPEMCDTLRQQAANFDTPSLVHMIVLLENVQRAIKSSSTARALFDAAIVRIALNEKFADVTRLLADKNNNQSTGNSSPSIAVTSKKKAPIINVIPQTAKTDSYITTHNTPDTDINNPSQPENKIPVSGTRSGSGSGTETNTEIPFAGKTDIEPQINSQLSHPSHNTKLIQDAAEIPIVRKAMELLDARIVDVIIEN